MPNIPENAAALDDAEAKVRSAMQPVFERAIIDGFDVVVSPPRWILVHGKVVFGVDHEMIEPEAPTPDGWQRYTTSGGVNY